MICKKKSFRFYGMILFNLMLKGYFKVTVFSTVLPSSSLMIPAPTKVEVVADEPVPTAVVVAVMS